MGLKLNFSKVKDGFEAKPNGWYKVRITDFEVKQYGPNAKSTPKLQKLGLPIDYLNIEFTIIGGEYDDKKFFTNAHVYIENALFTLKALLKCAGVDADGELDFDSIEEIGQTLMDTELMLKNVQRELDGDMVDNAKAFKPIDGVVANSSKNSVSAKSSEPTSLLPE